MEKQNAVEEPVLNNSINRDGTICPPFQKENELLSVVVPLPVFIPQGNSSISPPCDLIAYLKRDLETPRLDRIHHHLWLSGLPRAARPLHRQVLLNRSIVITEDPNEHLVWHESRMFIKPLPEYLLSHKFWTDHLEEEFRDESLYRAARGFLLSYCWIICRKSDLEVAHSAGLLPKSITWEKWVPFVADFISHVDTVSLNNVGIRYQYGELRLSRLNAIYMFSPSVFSVSNLVTAQFTSESTWYRSFFVRNFGWLFAVFAFISVVLSALQVGLGVEQLQGSRIFQHASRALTIASLILVASSVVLVAVVWFFLFCYHVIWAMRNQKKVQNMRERAQKDVI